MTNTKKIWDLHKSLVHQARTVTEDGRTFQKPLCGTADPHPVYTGGGHKVNCRSCLKRMKRG